MSMYAAGASKAGVNTADTAYFHLRSTAVTTRIKIFQVIVGIAVAPTTAPIFYLTRTSSNGTQTSTAVGQALDPSDPASLGTLDYVITGAPGFTAANKIVTGGLGITAGGAWVWTFPDDAPLTMAASTTGGIAIVNANASGATTGTFVGSMLWRE